MRGTAVNGLWSANLHDRSFVHDDHAICHRKSFGLAVCDIDEGDAKFFLEPRQHPLHVDHEVRVKGAEGFVQQ